MLTIFLYQLYQIHPSTIYITGSLSFNSLFLLYPPTPIMPIVLTYCRLNPASVQFYSLLLISLFPFLKSSGVTSLEINLKKDKIKCRIHKQDGFIELMPGQMDIDVKVITGKLNRKICYFINRIVENASNGMNNRHSPNTSLHK